MTFFLNFFAGNLLRKILTTGGIILALVGVRACDIHKQRKIGAARVIERSEQFGKQANDKASEDHARAAKPGAAERLLSSACRDCDG